MFVQPDEPMIVIDDIDVSHIITDIGVYEVKLTLDVIDVMDNAWLLKEINVHWFRRNTFRNTIKEQE